jgi:hypothetical protein
MVPDSGDGGGIFLQTQQQIVSYDNEFTGKWRRGFGWKKRP